MSRYLLARLLLALTGGRFPRWLLPRLWARGSYRAGLRTTNYSGGRITSHTLDAPGYRQTDTVTGRRTTTYRLGKLIKHTTRERI